MKTIISAFLIAAGIVQSAIAAPADNQPGASGQPAPAPAAKPETRPGAGPFTSRPPYQDSRIAGFAKRKQIDQCTVVFLGDSITDGWNVGKAFPKLRTANRGIASDTTRGMLCRLQETVLDLNPQAIVLLGGINDLRATNNPPGTPQTIAGNVELMLKAIQAANPNMPVLVCETLPGSIATPELIRETNQAVAQVVARFPQAVRIKTHDRFLGADGARDSSLYIDGVHLNPKGYAVWQAVLDEEFARIKLQRINTAVIPATQGGNGYDWMARHNDILKIKGELNPDLVFLGDSITHHWGGLPEGRLKAGEKVLKAAFAGHRVLNLGFGSDRTQQALWRLDHGELEGLKPKWVVVNIGTNNTTDGNTAEEIMDGIKAVCERIGRQTPDARIILMSIFPRDEKADCPRRQLIDDINRRIADYTQKNGIANLDIGAKFLSDNGSIHKALMPDFCHPVEKGYQFWAEALQPLLKAGNDHKDPKDKKDDHG